jgi:nitrogen regulatory protein P-II 1
MDPSPLNQVVAFIQSFQLEKVVDALRALSHFPGISVSEVRGFGGHGAHPPRAGEKAEVDPFEKSIRIEIFCRSSELAGIVETIRRVARTGHPGDGKIFVGPITLAYRIRTGESGEAAVWFPARQA